MSNDLHLEEMPWWSKEKRATAAEAVYSLTSSIGQTVFDDPHNGGETLYMFIREQEHCPWYVLVLEPGAAALTLFDGCSYSQDALHRQLEAQYGWGKIIGSIGPTVLFAAMQARKRTQKSEVEPGKGSTTTESSAPW